MYLGTVENVNKCSFGKFSKWMMAAGVTSQVSDLPVDESEKAAEVLKEETREFGVIKEEHSLLGSYG